jgi:hypothetical protein
MTANTTSVWPRSVLFDLFHQWAMPKELFGPNTYIYTLPLSAAAPANYYIPPGERPLARLWSRCVCVGISIWEAGRVFLLCLCACPESLQKQQVKLSPIKMFAEIKHSLLCAQLDFYAAGGTPWEAPRITCWSLFASDGLSCLPRFHVQVTQ